MAAKSFATDGNTKYTRFLNRQFLTGVVGVTVLAKYAKRGTLSDKEGTLTQRFFRKAMASKSRVTKITTEGDAVAIGSATIEYVDVAVDQYGDQSKISRRLQIAEIFDNIKVESTDMGEAAALKFDSLLRDCLVDATAGASNRIYAQGAVDFAALNTAGYTTGKLTCADLRRAKTILKRKRAPMIKISDGKNKWQGYIAVVSVEQADALQQDPDWKLKAQYSRPEMMEEGEIGIIYGVKIVETTEQFIEDGAGTENVYVAAPASTHKCIHTALVFGGEAFGATDLKTGGDWNKPKIVVLDKPDKSDAHNQWIVMAWSAYFGCVTLNRTWAVVLKSVGEIAA